MRSRSARSLQVFVWLGSSASKCPRTTLLINTWAKKINTSSTGRNVTNYPARAIHLFRRSNTSLHGCGARDLPGLTGALEGICEARSCRGTDRTDPSERPLKNLDKLRALTRVCIKRFLEFVNKVGAELERVRWR